MVAKKTWAVNEKRRTISFYLSNAFNKSIIRELTKENDLIVIQTLVCHEFFHVIEENNRKILENELIYDDGKYSINYDDLDKNYPEKKRQ